MKTFAFFVFLLVTTSLGYGQNENYTNAMLQAISSLDKVESQTDYQNLANTFERIASAENDQWLPSYYASFCYIMMGFMQQDPGKIDPLLDKAQKHIDKALEIASGESEIFALQGMLHQGRISVDPMARGMQYSQMAQASLEKAKKINPDNPRIYFLIAQNLYHTPPMFGGGPETACPVFRQADEKFKNFKPANELSPSWGFEDNTRFIESCK